MPSEPTTWQPMFLTHPAAFLRIMRQPALAGRMRAWPSFRDMLVGEALRHGRRADPEAMGALRELYAFGLNNGLPVRERLEAAAALREHLGDRADGGRAWDPFLLCDPAAEVALIAAEGRLESDPAGAAVLRAMIEERACPSRGAALAALLRRDLPELFALAGPLRHALDSREVADALRCCDEALPPVSQAFLADWLDSLDAAEEPELSDLLAQGITRQRAPRPDIRRIADHFLPGDASARPILRPATPVAARRRASRGADLPI